METLEAQYNMLVRSLIHTTVDMLFMTPRQRLTALQALPDDDLRAVCNLLRTQQKSWAALLNMAEAEMEGRDG